MALTQELLDQLQTDDPTVVAALIALSDQIDALTSRVDANTYDPAAMTAMAEFTAAVASRTGDERAAFLAAFATFMQGQSNE